MQAEERPPVPCVIYRRRGQPGICCAVRKNEPVPPFVDPRVWLFGARVSGEDKPPFGFQPTPAAQAMAALGYYLFHDPSETLSPGRRRRTDIADRCQDQASAPQLVDLVN